MKKIVSIFLLMILTLSLCATTILTIQAEGEKTVDMASLFDAKTFTSSKGTKLNYRIYLPKDYDAREEYPLILFLHGAGQRGDDNFSQLKLGINEPFKQTDSEIYNCIVVAPQCPTTDKWVNVPDWGYCGYDTTKISESESLSAVVELLENLQSTYSVDGNRLYVTGLSMGGFGTWDLLVRHPDLFAAAMPLCGGVDYRQASKIKEIPIWTFHGQQDETVPCVGTEKMVEELEKLNGNCIYTPMPDSGHVIWTEVYAREDVIPWLLSHHLSNGEEIYEPIETEAQTVDRIDDTSVDTANSEEGNAFSKLGCNGSVGVSALTVATVVAGAVIATKKRKTDSK